MFKVMDIVLRIGTKLQPLSIKVSDEVISLADGTKVQAIQFVKGDGSEGAIQYWTSEGFSQAAADVKKLDTDRAREIFAGVDVAKD